MKNLYNEKVMWGTHASVTNIDNKICQKVYTEYTLSTVKDHVIDTWVFNTIRDLNLESFVQLYTYEYDNIKEQIISYIMEYYSPYFDDVLNVSSEYIIENFRKIYNDIIILSNNGILIGDMNFSNIIFGKDGIKVIDFDNYKKCELSLDNIIKLNKNELCICFKQLYKNALYDIFINKFIFGSINKTMELFNPNVMDLPEHVTRKLIKYPNLISYFNDTKI